MNLYEAFNENERKLVETIKNFLNHIKIWKIIEKVTSYMI